MASRNIKDLDKSLQKAFNAIKERFEIKNPEYVLKLVCTYRPIEEQYSIYMHGRNSNGDIINKKDVLTYCDGTKMKSMHNFYPSRAFDVGIFKDDKYIPDCPLEKTLGNYMYGYAIKWGGNYSKFKDYPHFEML